MSAFPVHFSCPRVERSSRVQLALRVLAVLVVGIAGISFGGLFMLLYLGLALVSAVRISSLGSRSEYVNSDGDRLLFFLRWATAVSSWVMLVAERLPAHRPEETVQLTVERPRAQPLVELSAASAALRVLTGVPSLFVLVVLYLLGCLVWLWSALSILFVESVPGSAHRYLEGLQRYGARLLSYQAALVDEYPPFMLSEGESWGRPPEEPDGPASDQSPAV